VGDLICDAINYCAPSFDMGKLSVSDKIIMKIMINKMFGSNKFLC